MRARAAGAREADDGTTISAEHDARVARLKVDVKDFRVRSRQAHVGQTIRWNQHMYLHHA